jgi:hypothetical protein
MEQDRFTDKELLSYIEGWAEAHVGSIRQRTDEEHRQDWQHIVDLIKAQPDD